MGFLKHFRELVEDDLNKGMGKPVINKNLWFCMLLDFLLIQFILGPCNCFVWIGLWEFLDLYIDAHDTSLNLACLFVGLAASVLVFLFSPNFYNLSENVFDFYKGFYILGTRMYTVITFPFMVLTWKGWFGLVHICDNDRGLEVIISLGCLILGSLVLAILGCLKTAAVTPPLGIYLDDLGTRHSYAEIRQFYKTPEDPAMFTWKFRLINAFLTMMFELLALITYFGACNVVDFLGPLYLIQDGPCLTEGGKLATSPPCYLKIIIAFSIAITFAALSYIGSIGYLYLHYTCKSPYFTSTVKDLCYYIILVMATIGTATHFHAWWGLTEIITHAYYKNQDVPVVCHEETRTPEAAFFFLLLMSLGLIVLLLCGVSCNLHYGLEWELDREKDGILLPFFYFTYIFRDKEVAEEEPEEGSIW